MKYLTAKQFKHRVRDINKLSGNRKFCFILGAGASKSSGIPTGGELSRKWYGEIKDELSENEFIKWNRKEKINEQNLATYYGIIYSKRFADDIESGFEYLSKEMDGAQPSFGYSVLAKIISTTKHNIVVTTNFDSLVEASLYYYTGKHPLVCSHESLSVYAKPDTNRPLIAKIHRDLLIAPKSDPKEIKKLSLGWGKALDDIFKVYIPIVIGYGGNDGSLMGYFENMNNKPSNMFWCVQTGSLPSERVKKLVKKLNGHLVKTEGFDFTMFDMMFAMDEIKLIDTEIEDEAKRRTIEYKEQVIKIQQYLGKSEDLEVRKDAKNLSDKLPIQSAYFYYLKAQGEEDEYKKKEIYMGTLEKYPRQFWLWNKFANFLKSSPNKYNDVEKVYISALRENPDSPIAFNNYAFFLGYILKDYIKAEEYYEKALQIEPNNPNIVSGYAAFCMNEKKDYNKAEDLFERLIAIDINNPSSNRNIGIFLTLIKENLNKAEEYFLRAFILSPNDLLSYACLISLYFLKGENKKATEYLDNAFKYCSDDDSFSLAFWLHRYLSLPEFYKVAEREIAKHIKRGVRCPGWDFTLNVQKAIKDGHPNPIKIREILNKIA